MTTKVAHIYASNAKSLSITSTANKSSFIGSNIYCPMYVYLFICLFVYIITPFFFAMFVQFLCNFAMV